MQVSVKADVERVRAALRELDRAAIPKSSYRAINHALGKTRTAANSAIRDTLALRAGEVRKHLRPMRANRSTQTATLTATSGKATPVILLRARQVKGGVTYQVGRRGRRLIPGAFIQTMPGGHVGVFRRTKGSTHKGTPRRVKTGKHVGKLYKPQIPIKEQFAPSIRAVFDTEHVRNAMEATARGAWRHEFERLIRRELDRLR